MALSRPSLALSLLLLPLLVIASAGDYGDGSSKLGIDGIPAESPQPKPEKEEKSSYGAKQDTYKPKPEENDKPDYSKKPYVVEPKAEDDEKPSYGAKHNIYKQKPEEKHYSIYNRNSKVVKPKPEEKQYYGSKPDKHKQAKSDEKPRYGEGEERPKPVPQGEEKPYYGTKPDEKKRMFLSIAVQGLVICKTGSKYYPIKGASATITCKAVDEDGVDKTISVCSEATDAKGYFFATLSDSGRDKLKLRECKAYLKSSPWQTCNIPTNVNDAIEGALLSSFRILKEKNTKLYSVGPFFYTPEAKPAPEYGY